MRIRRLGEPIWVFPKDYTERVRAAGAKLYLPAAAAANPAARAPDAPAREN